MPTAAALADDLEARICAHANPVRAVSERAYLKSDLEFIGAGIPAIRATTRVFAREHPLDRRSLLALVRALWSKPLHERRAAAIELLGRHKKLLAPDDLTLIEHLIRHSGSWAYVDALATDIAGTLVEAHPALTTELDRWSRDEDFWVRRASMLALLVPLRRGGGDFERFAQYADAMLEEREFFIRKAIGWILRDTSKRRPGLVYDWLLPRAARASGVTVREAVKYLSADQREVILAAYAGNKNAPQAAGRTKRTLRTI